MYMRSHPRKTRNTPSFTSSYSILNLRYKWLKTAKWISIWHFVLSFPHMSVCQAGFSQYNNKLSKYRYILISTTSLIKIYIKMSVILNFPHFTSLHIMSVWYLLHKMQDRFTHLLIHYVIKVFCYAFSCSVLRRFMFTFFNYVLYCFSRSEKRLSV